MDSIPTTRQELERKTIEFLEAQLHLKESGRLSAQDLALMGKTAWSLTAGLIGDDVVALAAEVANSTKAEPIKRHFLGKGKAITVCWKADSGGYIVSARDALASLVVPTSSIFRCDISEREEKLQKVFKTFEAQGFYPL